MRRQDFKQTKSGDYHGWISGIPDSVYHGANGLSSSQIKRGKHCLSKMTIPVQETPAMRLGSLVHALVEERFGGRCALDSYVQGISVDRRTKKGKADWEDFLEKAKGRRIVDVETWDKANFMADSAAKHPRAVEMLGGGRTYIEESFFADFFGKKIKARPDYLDKEFRFIVDLKTTTDASPDSFAKSSVNFGYHLSAALYIDVVRESIPEMEEDFFFLCVEKEPPFESVMYQLDGVAIERGRVEWRETISRLVEEERRFSLFEEANFGYPKEIKCLSLPKWAQ